MDLPFANSPQLGFGVSGPHGSVLIDKAQTVELLRCAWEQGIRYFDTAPSYGAGEAEERLGAALAQVRGDDAIVSTKVGILSAGIARKRRDFSSQGVQNSIYESLKRLRRERIDILYLHGPDPSELTDSLLDVLERAVTYGDVGSLGVCGLGAELDAAASLGIFRQFMTPVNSSLTTAAMTRIAKLRTFGQVVGIEVLAATKKDHLPVSAGAIWRLARQVSGRAKTHPAQVLSHEAALRWALDKRADMVVTTTSRIKHLIANLDAIAHRAYEVHRV